MYSASAVSLVAELIFVLLLHVWGGEGNNKGNELFESNCSQEGMSVYHVASSLLPLKNEGSLLVLILVHNMWKVFMPWYLGFMAISYIWDIRWVITKSPWNTSHIVFSGCFLCVEALWAVKISGLQQEEWFVMSALQLQRTLVYVVGWCYLLVLLHGSSIKGHSITKQAMRTLYPGMSLWNAEKRSKHTSSALNS